MGLIGFENRSEGWAVRYGAGAEQGPTPRDIQFLDIKELNDLAGEYRARIRGLVADYRATRFGRQGFDLRQIDNLWAEYRRLMADSHEMTALYLAQLDSRKHQASRPTGKEYREAA